MKNKKLKILFILMLLIFNNKVLALEVGDKIKVEGHPGDFTVVSADNKYRCDLGNQKEPDPFKVTGITGSDNETIGYTYENLCTKMASDTFSWSTQFTRCDSIKGLFNGHGVVNKEVDTRVIYLNNISKQNNFEYSFQTNKKYGVIQLTTDESYNKFTEPTDTPTQNDPSPGSASKINCADYVDYYVSAAGTVKINCYKPDTMNCECISFDTKGNPYVSGHSCACGNAKSTSFVVESTLTNYDPNGPYNTVSSSDYHAPIMANAPGSCPGGYNETGRTLLRFGVAGAKYYSTGTTTTRYCEKVEPHRVDVYAQELVAHSNVGKKDDVTKEAYCVNPALNPLSNFSWDTSFDPNKCVDSLHSLNKKGEKVFDYECGYVYILAEAKRINAEVGKDIFSYSAISTAMRLFGTGITSKDNNLLAQAGFKGSEKNFLMAGGYYYKYKTWGLNEWIGIANPRNARTLSGSAWPMNSSWPAAYRWWMPELASIYIRTARNSNLYLQNLKNNDKNVRYTDVGKFECVSDINTSTHKCKGIDGKSYYYSYSTLDKKYYIVDATYYFNYKKCNMSYEACKCETKVIDLDIGADDRFNEELGSWPPDDAAHTVTCPASNKTCRKGNISSLRDFITDGTGRETSCTCEDGIGGLGVICGGANNDEKIKVDSNYLDAVYLYMKALQSNKIVYETKINEMVEQYTPVEGLTSVTYNAGDNSITIRFTIDSQTSEDEIEVDCDVNDPKTKEYCKVKGIYVYDATGKQIKPDSDNPDKLYYYDYCKKNYCYYTIKSTMTCDKVTKANKITSLVVTDPNVLSTTIKKLGNANKNEQILYVYDDTMSLTGSYCQNIEAVEEAVTYKCPCDPKEHPNKLEIIDIPEINYCKKNYAEYEELYYGDPSMSSIINACYDEDKLKYEYTEDVNANGNDIYYEAELNSKYSFQVKSDDFGVCKLYCRDENRFYIANKISVKSGRHLRYDVGQTLIDKKLIKDTAGEEHNYMPAVVLQLRECTSVVDYAKWKNLYSKASSAKQKNQLLYSIYNCNLYTTEGIKEKISEGKLRNVFSGKKEGVYTNGSFAESAMIEYKYNNTTGNVDIIRDYGTTKDYLLTQAGSCLNLGLTQEECLSYTLLDYDDSYKNELGIDIKREEGLVESNLNDTIYCSGEGCYKLKGTDGKYYYNPNPITNNKNEYTTVDEKYDNFGNKITNESGKILNYNDWALKHDEYNNKSDKYKSEVVDGNEVPTNEYASFIVVTELGHYNNKEYYADSYSGIVSTEKTNKNVLLDKNILPLHLRKNTGRYEIKHQFTEYRTTYKKNKYYNDKNYTLFDNINFKNKTFKYICEYDVYNTTTKYDDGKDTGLGFTYRVVNLEDMFESVSSGHRDLPENWATEFGKNTLTQIQNSAQDILELPNDGDSEYSYLEYSFVLTPEGINRIRDYNTQAENNDGYLNDTLYGCEYDEEEKIFYNCNSTFIRDLSDLNGKYSGLIEIKKSDGISEYCSSIENEKSEICKYQKKYTSGLLLGGE